MVSRAHKEGWIDPSEFSGASIMRDRHDRNQCLTVCRRRYMLSAASQPVLKAAWKL